MRQYMMNMNTQWPQIPIVPFIYCMNIEQIYILHVCSNILTFPQPLFFSTWCLSGLIWVECLIINFAFSLHFHCGATSFSKWHGMQGKFLIRGKINDGSFGKECPNSFSALSSIWPKAPCSNAQIKYYSWIQNINNGISWTF